MSAVLDYKKTDKKDAKEGRFPVSVESEYRVHFEPPAYEAMKKHAEMTTEVELCGVLVGEVKRDDHGPFLLVKGAIEGKNANNYGAQVTFTHQTWDHINAVKDKEFPNLRIVGWYHTHPGFGIFLSKMDMFIQENFFNMPFQIAVVLETKKNQEGCFAWTEGKSVPLQRYWVGEREVKLTTGLAEEFEDPGMLSPASPGVAAPAVRHAAEPEPRMGMSLFSMLFVVLAFLCGMLLGKNLMFTELHDAMRGEYQAEIYGTLEAAGVNALASKDMLALKEKMESAGAKLAKDDATGAAADLKEAAESLQSYEKVYEAHRRTFREDLQRLISTGKTLSNRISTTAQSQELLEKSVGMLYLMRIEDILLEDGKPVDPSKLSPAQLAQVKGIFQQAVRHVPEAKQILEAAQPELMNLLYPKEEAGETNKSGEEKAGSAEK